MKPMRVSVSDASGGAKGSGLVRFDNFAPGPISVQIVKTGTVNYTVQVSNDDPNDPVNPVTVNNMTWSSAPDTALVAQTGNSFGTIVSVPLFGRVLLNSGNGSVIGVFVQNSNGPI
jgi:hypothetical protein